MFRTARLAALFALVLPYFFFPAPAHSAATLTLIASESFDYSGNLVGKNGGTGYSGAWYSHYGSTSDYSIGSGLTYANITSAGGSAAACSSTNLQICGVARNFPAQENGVFYFQMIANFGNQTGSGTPTFRFFDSASVLSGGIGGNGGTAISILGTDLQPRAGGGSSFGLLNATSFVVLQIDFYSKLTQMWVNPNMATFDYFNPPAADATWPGLAPKMYTMAIYARQNGAKYDEFKIYRVDRPQAPELSATNTPVTYRKGVAASLVGTVDRSAKVTFLARGKRIAGCTNISTTAVSPFNATCSWKPTVTGAIPITMQITPTTGTPTEVLLTTAGVTNRTNRR
jgi:hypothetical protein